MKSLRNLLAAAVIGAMALASTVASAASAVGASVKSFAYDMGAAASDAAEGFLRASGLVLSLVTFTDTYTGKYPVLVQPDDSDADEITFPFTWPAVAPAVNDILALCKVPLNVKIVDWKIISDSADSNGAPTLAFSLGSLNSFSAPTALTTTYAAALAVAQGTNAGVARNASRACLIESNAADRAIGLLITAVAATYVPGAKGVLVLQVGDY